MTQIKKFFAGMSDSGNHISLSNKKKLFLILLTSFLLLTAIIAIIAGVSSRKSSGDTDTNSPSHAVLKSVCSTTTYPDLCYSAITSVPGAVNDLTTQRDVIEKSLNITLIAVEHNYFTVKKLTTKKGLTKREKQALHDCLELIDETLDELHKTEEDLEEYPTKKSISDHAADLKTLLSAAMTNQESCIDGFSHDNADKKVRKALLEGQIHVLHMCSNALAMIKNLTDTDMANESYKMGRRLGANLGDKSGFPAWLSAGDRRLLQSSTVTADVTVAGDGTGNYTTVSEAVLNAPEKSTKRYIIKIKAGVYRENVDIPKKKTYIMLLGDDRKTTIITANRSVSGGSTTFHSATVAAVGERFLAKELTFENTAGASNHQAVALRVGSDLSAFYRCDMIGHQDTLYVHSNRQFFVECFIAGTVDFIFGNAAAVFQDCDIHARRPNSGQRNMVTAQGRVDKNQNTGIVIQKCRIDATSDLKSVRSSFPTYLGRPWKLYSRTVIMQSTISNVIHPAGWFEWDGDFALDTLEYIEYANLGDGAEFSGRVKWGGFKVIDSVTEAAQYTVSNFIGGDSWLESTGFPFSPGL